ncbi:hypothetical protein FEM48_Zijuj10G0018700 [Ziziphus jujuba var. spinosa]|uniref:Uncharacterized protein n=1 Tax=Ziziphus jujuba var. spinosa TaxID=714518 RepID=A0A978UKL2_ZIZJJ|nr:hypothetical protein FEM48_Zijuj10G0018700 [Ziziphus jujuba var. spinosa]
MRCSVTHGRSYHDEQEVEVGFEEAQDGGMDENSAAPLLALANILSCIQNFQHKESCAKPKDVEGVEGGVSGEDLSITYILCVDHDNEDPLRQRRDTPLLALLRSVICHCHHCRTTVVATVDENSSSSGSSRCVSTFLNVVVLGNVIFESGLCLDLWRCWFMWLGLITASILRLGLCMENDIKLGVGKLVVLNSLIGHPILPTGENGATRAPISIDLQSDGSLSSKLYKEWTLVGALTASGQESYFQDPK